MLNAEKYIDIRDQKTAVREAKNLDHIRSKIREAIKKGYSSIGSEEWWHGWVNRDVVRNLRHEMFSNGFAVWYCDGWDRRIKWKPIVEMWPIRRWLYLWWHGLENQRGKQ